MSWRIHQVYKIFFTVLHIEESDGAGLHGDPPLLLVLPAVHVAEFPRQAGGDDAVGGNEAVRQTGLAMVNMGQDTNVPDVFSVAL